VRLQRSLHGAVLEADVDQAVLPGSLRESKALLASRAHAVDGWRQLAHRKLAELDEQIAKSQAAREAITHALRCQHEDIATCPNFAGVIAARLAGKPLAETHLH